MKILTVSSIIILLLVGCEGFQSPAGIQTSGPSAELSINSTTTATLHAFLVVDTNADDSSRAFQADLNAMNTLTETIASHTGMMVNKLVFSGNNATFTQVLTGIHELVPGTNDAVVFYYSGHGGRTSSTPTPWPNLYFMKSAGENGLNLSDVFQRLTAKGPRLLLVMGDTCNSVIDIPSRTSFAHERSNGTATTNGYRKLFAESRAAILASGSQPGEFSYATTHGGLFTQQFIAGLNQLADDNPGWSDVMNRATRPISVSGVQQHPQYMMQ